MEQVFYLPDLTGGVAFKAQAGIGFTHTFPVVGYLYKRFAGVVNDQPDLCRACVNGIFQQFLYCTSRSLYHFPCRDLIGNMIGQQ